MRLEDTMMNPYILEEEVKARQQAFLCAAEHARLVRQAQAAKPSLITRLHRSLVDRLIAWGNQRRPSRSFGKSTS
jgi:hypothetical protein